MANACIFCAIVNGENPATVIAEDENTICFLDIRPINKGHILIVPKEHAESLCDLDDLGASSLMPWARKISAAQRRAVGAEGINLYLADGELAGQEVPHIHLHVIPRFAGDGFRLRFGPNYGQIADRVELESLAKSIRASL